MEELPEWITKMEQIMEKARKKQELQKLLEEVWEGELM